jgi:EpsI family protein
MLSKTVPWLAAAAMLCCAALSYAVRPQSTPPLNFKLDDAIPMAFGEWRVDPSVALISPTPDVQASLDKIYDQIVSRAYVNAQGERVMLVIAYGGDQSDSLKAHRQEVCYAAQGFAIHEVRTDSMSLAQSRLDLVRVHAQKGSRTEPISYWFTMGERVATGRTERLITQIGYGLVGQIPDGLLVRVSSVSPQTASAYNAHDTFVRALMGAVSPQIQARLAGVQATGT